MKKKLIIGLLVLISVFTFVGCTSNSKKEKFYELRYVEPKGFKGVIETGTEENRLKNFYYGDYDGSINMNYQKGSDYTEIEELYYNKYTEKEINGTTWRVMDDETLGVVSRFYYTVYNNNLYLIELNGYDKYKKDMEEFINNISFE